MGQSAFDTMRSPVFTMQSSGGTVVHLPRDMDLCNASAVRDGLVALLDRGIPSLIMNMTGTLFCDCSGIRVLMQVGHHARGLSTPVCVALPPDGPVRRVAELTDLGSELQVATGTAAARRWLESVPVEEIRA